MLATLAFDPLATPLRADDKEIAERLQADRISKVPWLPEGFSKQFIEASKTTEIARGKTVFSREDPSNYLYLVLTGIVSVSWRAAERSVLMDLGGANDIVGISSLFGGSHPFCGEAITDCKVTRFSSATFRELALDNPTTFDQAMQCSLGRWESLLRRYAHFTILSSFGRIALTLV